jgi:CubicO group peptidase (beta-lactamase class C family)
MKTLRWLSFLMGLSCSFAASEVKDYFPHPDSDGGWRTLTNAEEIRRVAGMDVDTLDATLEYIKGSTKNGGLLVARNGWLVYERYFGLGHREATPNLASCSKSFTSISVGILMSERPELFPEGLDQRIFTPAYFPPEAFPLTDPRKEEIKLGQLLAFSAGIRGNNPAYVEGRPTILDPAGPDGWQAMVDAAALGRKDYTDRNGRPLSTQTLWCAPGEGYSYASSSIHLASIMLRHVTGMELQEYVRERLAGPLGWGRWGWGYKYATEVTHTPGAGGIALRGTDMLRFGYLLLREGRWNDRQLVPAEYVRHCSRASPYNRHFPYSLQFDVNTSGHVSDAPRDAFWKSGSGGHVLYVVPSLDLVIWKLGGRDGQYSPRDTGMPTHPDAAREARPRESWTETVGYDAAKTGTLQRVVGAIVDRAPARSSSAQPRLQKPIDLSSVPLRLPDGRLLVNLMMEGRLAWFSWMDQQRFKPKLVVEWTQEGRMHSKIWQHGLDGSNDPQAFFLLRGTEPGHVRWGAHPDLGIGREGHKHHFFSKDRPSRVGFIKADLSEIPRDANITHASLVLHIHDKEGLKAMPDGEGTGRFRHVNKDWDWDHITFTHFAADQPWSTPIPEYPFLGDGDVSPVLWSLRRQQDVAAQGYHKNAIRDYPLDLTAYVRRLQHLRADHTPLPSTPNDAHETAR